VFTGDSPTAGTDANVACVLVGRDEKTRTLQLESKARLWTGWDRWLRNPLKFCRNREEVFLLQAEDVGDVHSVHFWHDNTYVLQTPSFFLHRIEVLKLPSKEHRPDVAAGKGTHNSDPNSHLDVHGDRGVMNPTRGLVSKALEGKDHRYDDVTATLSSVTYSHVNNGHQTPMTGLIFICICICV
jgi:hypothetical protein